MSLSENQLFKSGLHVKTKESKVCIALSNGKFATFIFFSQSYKVTEEACFITNSIIFFAPVLWMMTDY